MKSGKGKVHLELLLGRQVRDTEGARVGRILSVIAEREGEEHVIREYHLGTAALLARLGIPPFPVKGWPARKPVAIPWDLLDLSDPEHPRLRCPAAELKAKKKIQPL